ncbi:MAG: aminotransferase class V-fold PLP-dependent enzyme [Flavobacteriales bacterium]
MSQLNPIAASYTTAPIDWNAIRADFPLIAGHDLIYFDNAASSQKPKVLLEAMENMVTTSYANVHRGVHRLSQQATDQYEAARKTVAKFINAADEAEVVFTGGTTDSINTLAYSFGEAHIQPGDEILLSGMEHHANIVPWQLMAERKGAHIKVIPVLENGSLDLEALDALMGPKTKLLSLVWVSNSLGTVNPIPYLIQKAHAYGIPVMVDAAQAAPHMPIDVQAIDCDFLAFSAHKMCGPTGLGVLYGKRHLFEPLPPYRGGGDMIDRVRFEKTTFQGLPFRFEAGTPHILGAVAFASVLAYLSNIGMRQIEARERQLSSSFRQHLQQNFPEVNAIGTAADSVSVVSFLVKGHHPMDVGVLLDNQNIAVRTGHHCCQPLMDRFGIPGTVRASLAFYNTEEEIERFFVALRKTIQLLR